MDKRSDTSTRDNWLERALARWEWEGGHVAPSEERGAALGGKKRTAPNQDERVPITHTAGKPVGH